ncbi:MAG: uroporphyrinogen decarboxylase [Microbacteriaceae bacterium]|nr:MAG: uroporphyrinogen decarboxylase [Microbacteriaceae bacterium]
MREDGDVLSPSHPLTDGRTSASSVVRAARGERPERTPVWFMHRAGRTLPERREAPDGIELLDAYLSPDRAAELTLQPVRSHGIDAAVLFTDVLVPVRLAGVDVRFDPERGPVLDEPIRTASDVLRLRPIDPAVLAPLSEAVRIAVAELGDTPLIAVGGAPFSLASALVEGGPSSEHLRARSLMYSDPHTWAALLNWCADVTGAFLRAQVESGASAAQLVDPGIVSLSRRDYQRRVAPHSKRAFDALRGLEVPKLHVGPGGEALDLFPAIGADVVGVDWRIPLDEASARLGGGVPLQGNLDPALLAAPWPVLQAHVEDVLDRGLAAPAHIVNLGADVPPGADPDVLTRIVELVHARL